ncbi:MAG: glutamine synthetase, partial [Chloroflexi bacterium]|nr:glutamine synthetase [Chloroflexota bacterium]
LAALKADHDYLLDGNVFTKDLIDTYIEYKTTVELDEFRLRPTPYEFYLYFDC